MKVEFLPFYNKIETTLSFDSPNLSRDQLSLSSSSSSIKMGGAIEKLGKGASTFWYSNFSNDKSIKWDLFKET